jgi:septum formation protein
MTLILASASPRRQELLKKITNDFLVVPSEYDESQLIEDNPIKFALTAAMEKAKDVLIKHTKDIVIGADTIVVLEGKILGKPKDTHDAKNTLKMLSGKTHQVITGVVVLNGVTGKALFTRAITEVTFNELSDEMIDHYVLNHKVLDKAGSYAIQEIGDKFVRNVKGDMDNVIGLPTEIVRSLLKQIG